jgi:hypothetical protein
MTRHMRDGTQDEDGVRWLRCPSCGDSQTNRGKAHMMVDTDGKTYCFKCNEFTQLSIGALLDIALGNKTLDETVEESFDPDYVRGEKEQARFTRLETYEEEDVPGADAFEMRNQHGKRVGWHIRFPRKQFKNEGDRGIGYVSSGVLRSTPAEPLVLVEVPYDVVKDHYVCVFGTINAGGLSKYFKIQWVWLYPDPDQVDTSTKRERFLERVVKPALDAGVFIQGVILGNDDPDKATKEDYVFIDDVLETWSQSTRRSQVRSPIHQAIAMR